MEMVERTNGSFFMDYESSGVVVINPQRACARGYIVVTLFICLSVVISKMADF